MKFTRRRAAVVLMAAAAMIGQASVAASPAQAATCVSVPGGTPGSDVRIAGQDHRVPEIANVRVCSDGATAPLVTVDLAGHGNCLSLCFSVLLEGNDLDAGAITLSYTSDGAPQSSTTNPPPVDGPAGECLLSVGSPDAPYPTCFNAIGPDLGDPVGDVDELAGGLVTTAWGVVGTAGNEANEAIDTAEAVVADAQADAVALANQVLEEIGRELEPVHALAQNLRELADDPCGGIPPQSDPNQWEYQVEFCDQPTVWVNYFVWNFCNDNPNRCAVHPDQVAEVVQEAYCLVAPEPPWYCYE